MSISDHKALLTTFPLLSEAVIIGQTMRKFLIKKSFKIIHKLHKLQCCAAAEQKSTEMKISLLRLRIFTALTFIFQVVSPFMQDDDFLTSLNLIAPVVLRRL